MLKGFELLVEAIRIYLTNWTEVNKGNPDEIVHDGAGATIDEKVDYIINLLFGRTSDSADAIPPIDWVEFFVVNLPDDLADVIGIAALRQLTHRGFNPLCDKAIKRLNLTLQSFRKVANKEEEDANIKNHLAISIYESIALCRLIDKHQEVNRLIAETELMFLHTEPTDKLVPLGLINEYLRTAVTPPTGIAPPPKPNPSFDISKLKVPGQETEEAQTQE